ncbi:MAG: ABC transporter permease [Nitrospirae bacterium]|nr:ABC transporter permease [Nitrospirota bacterium]
MTGFQLVVRNAGRHKLRTALTVLGLAIAVLAFAMLRTIVAAWYAGVEASQQNRLVTRNAVSLAFPLPLAYRDRIAQVPGVTQVSYANWFGGVYIDEKNFFAQFAVDAPTWFRLYSEYHVSPAQMETFQQERNAAIVGEKLAQRYGWHLGDTVRLRGTFFPGDWDFVIRGLYTTTLKSADNTQFFFHWERLDQFVRQTLPDTAGNVGFYAFTIDRSREPADVSRAVDALFANSLAETLTETEREFQLGFVSMTEAILMAIQVISFLIVGLILIVLANTMAMAARERVTEYAVLKTLGFSPGRIARLIMGESLVIAAAGAVVGVIAVFPLVGVFAAAVGSFFPVFELSPVTVAAAVALDLSAAIAAAAMPAWGVARTTIADGLRRVG